MNVLFMLLGKVTRSSISYLPVKRMFETMRAEFSQFQSTRRIVSILLSNISGNA